MKNSHVVVSYDAFTSMIMLTNQLAAAKGMIAWHYAMHDIKGFGYKRLIRLHETAMAYNKQIDEGTLKMGDMVNELEACGVDMAAHDSISVRWANKVTQFGGIGRAWHQRRKTAPEQTARLIEVEHIANATVEFSIEQARVLMAYTLRKVFGYGAERIETVNTKFCKTLSLMDEGYLSLRDMRDVLDDEADIVVERAPDPPADARWVKRLRPIKKLYKEWR